MGEKDVFAERLRRRRMARGWSQKDLAARLRVRPATISRYESGTYRAVSFDRLRQLADVLATSTDYLLGRLEDPGPVPDRPSPGEASCLHSYAPPLYTATPLIRRQDACAVYHGPQAALHMAGPAMAERRFLDEPFVLERLARTGHSSLPLRLRNELARMVRRLSTMRRELRQQAPAVQRERDAEEPADQP